MATLRQEGTPMTGTRDSTHLRLPVTVRVAALLFLFLGVAFGASVPFVLAHLGRYGELPMTFWFRSMAGPFEQLGPETFTALGWISSQPVPPTWSPASGSGAAVDGEPGSGSLPHPWCSRSAWGSTCP